MSAGQIDRYIHENLPPPELWPEILALPDVPQSGRLNCADFLLDKHATSDAADRLAVIGEHFSWTYAELNVQSNRIANVMQHQFGIISGNRVLIRAPNEPMAVAIWLAVQKLGAIAVTTVPLLRRSEITEIIEIAKVSLVVCETTYTDAISEAECQVVEYGNDTCALESLTSEASDWFEIYQTNADDIALIGFTSGTTGKPKATIHFHRDVLSICKVLCDEIIHPTRDDIFIGTAPLAFTFGLGGLLAFPLYAGASSVLMQHASPEGLLEAIASHRATICFTVPTFYQRMARCIQLGELDSLRLAVSSGEALPDPVRRAWLECSGLPLAEVLGSTEMLHAFLGADSNAAERGAIGPAFPGYEVAILDDAGQRLPANSPGRLAVKGPTGCRYLNDPRQKDYVVNGWNITGDTCSMTEDDMIMFHARKDDMIITSGYNVSGIEVENALLTHPKVAECAVIGEPDSDRGNIVSAFVVLNDRHIESHDMAEQLQNHVKAQIAPYKYPRKLTFVRELPRNSSGKIQRHRLR